MIYGEQNEVFIEHKIGALQGPVAGLHNIGRWKIDELRPVHHSEKLSIQTRDDCYTIRGIS